MRENVMLEINIIKKYYINFVKYSPFCIEHAMEIRDLVLFKTIVLNNLSSTGTTAWQRNV